MLEKKNFNDIDFDNNESLFDFINRFKVYIFLAIGIRVSISLIANFQPDTSVWFNVIKSVEKGLPIYRDGGGFSYPPIFVYWLQSIGEISKFTGIHFYSVSESVVNFAPFNFLGTFCGNLIIKLPLIFADFFTGYFIYHIVRLLSADDKKSKTALLLWIFNPLVIFISSVHAQLDCMEVAFLMGCIFHTLKKQYFLSGLFLALSVDTKLMTIFLVPTFIMHIVRNESYRLAFRFIMTFLTWVIIFVLPYLSANFLSIIFQRDLSTAGVHFGGLGFFGLLNLPGSGGAATFIYTHSIACNLIGTLIELMCSIIFALIVWTSKSIQNLLTSLSLVVIVLLLFNSLSNPQYLDLLIPFLCILRAQNQVVLVQLKLFQHFITYSGLFFYTGLVGLSGLFYTTSSAIGFPSLKQINDEFNFMNSFSNGPGFLPNTNGHTIFLFCTLFTTISLIYIFQFLLKFTRNDNHRK